MDVNAGGSPATSAAQTTTQTTAGQQHLPRLAGGGYHQRISISGGQRLVFPSTPVASNRRHITRVTFWLVVLVFAFPVAGRSCAELRAASARAEQFLADERGLVQQRQRWLLPLELQLRGRVRLLPKLQSRLERVRLQTEQTYQVLSQRNVAVQTHLGQVKARLAQLESQPTARLGQAQRQVLAAQIKRERQRLAALEKEQIEPEKYGAVPIIQRQLIDLTNRRNDLATTILNIHDERHRLREGYQELSQDRQVAAALNELGEDHRLGPLADYDSKRFLQNIRQYEDEVFTAQLPLYRAGEHLRVAAIINRTPVTFTWHTSSEPTLLTASVIEATGLRVPGDAPQMTRRFDDGRKLVVREFEIPYLRFGRHELRNVSAFALPPEGENIGTHIGPAAFEDAGIMPRAEPEKLRLVLQ